MNYTPSVKHEATTIVKHTLVNTANGFIRRNKTVEDAGKSEILHKVTVDFGMIEGCHYEADIKVVNSENGPYVDPVLFRDGNEVCVIEPASGRLDGEYIFLVDINEVDHYFYAFVKKDR
jgi:hypothetical protein